MTLYTRAMWNAAPARQMPTPFSNGFPNSTTVHAVGGTVGVRDEYTAMVRSIQAHAFGKGLSDIDYNMLVDVHGNIYEGRGTGVKSGAQGVGNSSSLAVCYLDNGDGDVPFSLEAQTAIHHLNDLYAAHGVIHPHRWWNAANTAAGHGEYATFCPGNEIAAWCDNPTATGDPDMPLTNADDALLRGGLGNYIIGAIQNSIKEQRALAVTQTVKQIVDHLPVGTVDGQALAETVANELAARLVS